MDDDMPFNCSVADCGARFTNVDHLNAHTKKHEMSLALNSGGPSSSSPAHHFLDQTPTPTKFLKNCEEIGLFQELSKNPFDDAYKKALDPDPSPLPGPAGTNELNTPTLILTDSPQKQHATSSLALPSSLPAERNRGTESHKPSPLLKSSTGSSTLVLDLSGKSVTNVIAAQPSSTTREKVNESNLTSQDADSTSMESPLLESVLPEDAESSLHTQIQCSSLDSDVMSTSRSSPHSTTNVTTSAQLQPKEIVPQSAGQEIKIEPGDDAEAKSNSLQQCTMQVLLQLPSGETVPINIPATINSIPVLGGQQRVQEVKQKIQQVAPLSSQQQQQAPQIHLPQQQQQAPQIHLPQQQAVLQHSPVRSRVVSGAPSSQPTTLALKQKLKAQLQSQLSPTAKSTDPSLAASHSSFIPAAPMSTSSCSSQMILSSGSPIMMVDSPGSEVNMSDSSEYSFDSKRQKMSPETGDPEERRRKFLERNRAAAARCRQKRKHWISNLEKKADELQNTNVRLQSEVKLLRGEVAQLKTLLLAHKDCPITQQQKSQGQLQHIILTDASSLPTSELAQVVPTGESGGHEQLHLGQTIVAFVQEAMTEPHDDLQHTNLKRE